MKTSPHGIVSFIDYYDETGLVRNAGHRGADGTLVYRDRYNYFPGTPLYRTIVRTTPQGDSHVQYTYDSYQRLESTTDSATGRNVTYGYDDFGNRTSETIDCPAGYVPAPNEKPCGAYTYQYTPQSNRLDGVLLNGQTYGSITYDNAGRIKTRVMNNVTMTYTFDDRGLLTKVDKPGTTVTYTYDALGARKSKTVNGTKTYYVTANLFGFSRVLQELNASGNPVATNVFGGHAPMLREVSGNRNYLLHEGTVGSVTHSTDNNGAINSAFAYDAFGNPNSSATAAFGYTGEQFDAETGLLYLRARYYDPGLGRFISADPFWGRLEDPVSQNRYIYVQNNPLLFTDPSGLDTKNAHLCGGITTPLLSLSGCLMVVSDDAGNRGILWSEGSGKGAGWDLAVAVQRGNTSADTIFDLTGKGVDVSGSASAGRLKGLGGTTTQAFGAGYTGTLVGPSVSLLGTRFSGSAMITDTELVYSERYRNPLVRIEPSVPRVTTIHDQLVLEHLESEYLLAAQGASIDPGQCQ